jgi:predicted DNA binding CopG/RHH family protein
MAVDAAFMKSLEELREEFKELEQSLKNEDEAHRRQRAKESTTPVFLRIPANLLEKIDESAGREHRNRQNYIIKVLYEAER